jgi:hypothetical protein
MAKSIRDLQSNSYEALGSPPVAVAHGLRTGGDYLGLLISELVRRVVHLH